MRIDTLRFKNLNSLAGEWSVDFQDTAFTNGGIFAITGPTGAGKTTLLDALCLALFGRTPRLKTLSTATNEIMTHGTGDCFAEATFTTAKGRFRCHWSQRRARGKRTGRLQPPQHEIVDDADGTVLETKLRQVARRVTAVTGLDFDRFTRSILLAQGGFAAFLQAGPDQRAPILEEITGTGIYSEISMGVHERLRQEGAELDRLRVLLDSLELPDDESEAQIEVEQANLSQRLRETASRHQALARSLAWRERLAALEAELKTLAHEAETLKAEAAAARPDMERLARAEKAQPLNADHERLKLLRIQLSENTAAQDSLSDRQKQLSTEIENARNRSAAAETRLTAARHARQAADTTLKAVRALDLQRGATARQVEEQQTVCQKQQAAMERVEVELAAARTRLSDSQTALQETRAYLEAHPEDAGLATAMAGLRHRCHDHEEKHLALKTLAEAAAKAHRRLTNTKGALAKTNRTVDRLQAAEKALENQLGVAESRLQETLAGSDLASQRRRCERLSEELHATERARELAARREKIAGQQSDLAVAREKLVGEAERVREQEAACQKEKTLSEQAVADKTEALTLLRRVADLEEERRHLRIGEPCPLCGGRDHPWAEGTPPEPDKAREALFAAQAALADTEKRLQDLIAKHSRVASRLEETATQLKDLDAGKQEIDAALAAIDLPGSKGEGAPLTASERHQRMVDLRNALNKGRDLLAAAEELEKEINAHRAELEQARSELAVGENQGRSARFEKEAAAREAARLDKEIETLEEVLQNLGRRLLEELGPYGIDALPEGGAGTLLDSLAQRLKDYARQQEAAERWQTTIRTQTHAVELKAQHLHQTAELLSQAQARLEILTLNNGQLNRERRDLFGEKDPDDEEVRLAQAVTQAEGQQQTAARQRATLAQEAAAAAARTQSLAEQGDRLKSDLAGYQAEFDAALTAAGFRDEADLANGQLSRAEMDRLSAKKEALAKTAATLTARKSDRQEALATARAQQLTTATRDDLLEEIEVLDAQRQALQARAGAISQQRAQIASAKARQAEFMKRCERQSAVCQRWGRLHDLIGSADGKKFRVFAQGLTFEQVVTYANQELQKMSDRYIMIRDRERPLNLLMADDYQGGVLRATDNLSGGESFLVSLALALGLAKMASRNVRLDSLFLDEGFGTLDEETLEIALDTLGGLRQEGKLIGVISHVATLKERIPTQIKVLPGNNGRSTLAGPGCRGGGDTSQKVTVHRAEMPVK